MREALRDWNLDRDGAVDDDDEESDPDDDDDDLGPDIDDADSDGEDDGDDDGNPGPGDGSMFRPGTTPEVEDGVYDDYLDGASGGDVSRPDRPDGSSSSSHPDSFPSDEEPPVNMAAVPTRREPPQWASISPLFLDAGPIHEDHLEHRVVPGVISAPFGHDAPAVPTSSDTSSEDVPPPRRRVRPVPGAPISSSSTSTSSSAATPVDRREPLRVRVTEHGGSSRREVLRSPMGFAESLVPVEARDMADGEAECHPPGDPPFVPASPEPSPPTTPRLITNPTWTRDDILTRVWVGRTDPLPSVGRAFPGSPERPGELSYVRSTYLWELAVIFRNLTVRRMVDPFLAPEDLRFIEEYVHGSVVLFQSYALLTWSVLFPTGWNCLSCSAWLRDN